MPAGTDLIFFDNPEDWVSVANVSQTAQIINENSHTPIPPIDLGVSLNEEYIAVIAGTTSGKPSWQFAGDIRQVYNFAKEAGNPILGKVQSAPTKLFINKLQVVETTRISPDNFRLRYTPPFWFKNCTVRVYKYVGDALNFVEDTLFDIGNALGIRSSQDGEPALSTIEQLAILIQSRFNELDTRLNQEDVEDAEIFTRIQTQLNEVEAGVFTVAEGVAELLPPEQASNLLQNTRNRLNLDLGFL